MPSRLESLVDIEAACWRELGSAVADPTHPWRTPALATVDGDGADARTVVLREVREPSLWFYSDHRAPKLAQVARRPRGTLLMWSRPLGWQLRCRVDLRVLSDEVERAARWAAIQSSRAALDYLAALAPGSPLDAATAEQPNDGTHFAVLIATVTSIDWLELHHNGHRRARFETGGAARWLQP